MLLHVSILCVINLIIDQLHNYVSFVFIFFFKTQKFNNNSSLCLKCVINNIPTYIFTIDPQPPGPINTTASNLHPQTLFLSWERSQYSSNVNRYGITIGGRSGSSYSNSLSRWVELEPGRYYTVRIVAIHWSPTVGEKWSPAYSRIIQTLRK